MTVSKGQLDVLGLGCTAVDELLYVAAYPPADAKARVLERERHCGGLTATALVAAARLGARCAYAGALGDDEHSRFVRESLAREGICVDHVVRRAEARPVRSVILVDERRKTRNIFYDTRDAMGADPKRPAGKWIQSSRVLLVDRYGVPGMIRAARLARAAGVAVVGDFENRDWPRFEELFALPDHLIVSAGFACQLTRARTPAEAAIRLWTRGRSAVVVTCGAEGCWFWNARLVEPAHFPAYRVTATDTTGCGDVFHGAYAAALARGLALEERIRVASATAALKATQRGGQSGIPTWSEVQAWLAKHG
jgi:sugar/nucleoside kinase (ribokinase family)